MKRTPKGAPASINSSALKLAPVTQIFNPDSNEVDQNCIDCLRSLLREAEAGEISGFIYAVMRTEGGYTTDAVGLAHDNSTFGIGVLEVLKERLLKKVFRS